MIATAALAAWSTLVPLAQADVGSYHYTGRLWATGSLPEQPTVEGHAVTGKSNTLRPTTPYGARALVRDRITPPAWPTAATGTAALTAAGGHAVRAGSTPVSLAAAKATPSARSAATTPQSVRVSVAGHGQARSAGVDGLLVGLSRADGSSAAGRVKVSLDYSSIAGAYGGGWASRLRLVAMPACALTMPKVTACQKRTPLATVNDPRQQTLSASVDLPAGEATAPSSDSSAPTATAAPATMSVALAAVSGTSGSQGDYSATSLSASGAWSQSGTGAFTYSYPIAVPPSLGGTSPSVALSYDSQSVDGETSARNAQSSWIGDGWSFEPGYIERSYKSCNADGIKDSGDECWAGYNATLSLGSHNGELVRDSSGAYHLQADDGTKIQRLTGASNGLWDGEYYKVTTTDGTAYYFGLNHTPGTTGDASTDSAWGVPAYHPKSSDPCYDSAEGDASQCALPVGYRFNLDFVVDPHGNVQRYDYATETNYYNMGYGQVAAGGGGGTLTSYVRAGRLTAISYGYRLAEARAGSDPAARVLFTAAQRCVTSDTVCQASNLSDTTATNWPDVPYDIHCDAGDPTSGTGDNVCRTGSPTFWSTYRLKTITTQIMVGTAWSSVDSYDLTHVFSDAGGTIDPVTGATGKDTADAGELQAIMWLSAVQHTGLDTGAGASGTLALDPVTFEGVETDNRVDGLTPAAPPLYHPRISAIHTETGEEIVPRYAAPQCSRTGATMPASPDTNTMTCFPVYWTPPGAVDPIVDWFNKSLITEIDDNDATTAGSTAKVTKYSYSGAAWHRDDSDLTDDRYRTWNGFRGFRTVITTSGQSPDPITKSITTYMQGMNGDYLADGTTRKVSIYGVYDNNWLSGIPRLTRVYNTSIAGTPLVAQNYTDEPTVTSTATRSRTAWTSQDPAPATLSTLPALVARRADTTTGRSLSLLAHPDSAGNAVWRTGKSVTSYDSDARVVTIDAQADITDPAQETCTRTAYAPAPASNPMMLSYPSQVTEVAGTCSTAPGAATTVMDKRIFYDGDGSISDPGTYGVLGQPWPSDGSTPTVHSLGYVTAVQTVKSYDSSGNPTYVLTGALSYDGYGRITRSLDGAGWATGTAYTPATGTLPTSVTTTNPLGWTSTNTLDPGRGLVTESQDANGRLTDSTFDALGRRTAAWLPGNSKSTDPNYPDRTFAYAVHGKGATAGQAPDPASVTTRTLREDDTYGVSVDIYDGMLQLRQTQSTTANNSVGRLVTSHFYDSHGWARETINTYSDPGHTAGSTLWAELETTVPSEVTTQYDGLGRPTKVQQWAKAVSLWQSTTTYAGADETDTTPPPGGLATTSSTNGLGQTTSTVVHDTTPDRTLTGGAVIASGSSFASDSVRLSMQADGNLVLKGIATGATLWSSGTAGNAGASATIRTDGSLVVTSTGGTELWNSGSGTAGSTGARLVIGDDASLQVRNSAGTSVWNSGTAGQANPADVTTAYTYTPSGKVSTIADTVGNTWTYAYDVQGEMTSQSDPDAGTSTYGYDDYGRLVHSTDARGTTLSYAYDVLGRRTGEYSGTDTTVADNQLASWTYDTLGDGTQVKGLPVAATRYVGGSGTTGSAYVQRIDGYNTAYQPTGTTTVVPASEGKLAGTYSMKVKYTPRVGLLSETDYGTEGGLPKEYLGYGYDLQGLLMGTGSDTTSYLDLAQYTPLGQVVQSTYGPSGKQLRTAQTYDAATGRLATYTVSPQTATTSPVDATTYGYDASGNLSAVSDVQSDGSTTTGTDTQCFGYDGQGRLAEAWTDTQGITTPAVAGTGQLAKCNTAVPSASTIGGPAPYWQSYTYNLLGDRTQEVSHNTGGNALDDITQSFAYPGGNGTTATALPNRTTSVTTTGPSGTTTLTPQYDDAGNTVDRDTKVGSAAPTRQALGYDDEGRTRTVGAKAGGTGSSTYLYDADGGLLLQKSSASNVLYLFGGAEQLSLDNAAQTVTGLRYYANPDGTVIVRSSTGTITYQPTSPQHTAQLQIDADTLTVTRRAYDPYGNPRGANPAGWADNHGYLGRPADATTGLDLLGARNYDPVLGRFLSVDPVLEAGDANEMGGYAYAGDDPVNGSDPSGLMLPAGDSNITPRDQTIQYCYAAALEGVSCAEQSRTVHHGWRHALDVAVGTAEMGGVAIVADAAVDAVGTCAATVILAPECIAAATNVAEGVSALFGGCADTACLSDRGTGAPEEPTARGVDDPPASTGKVTEDLVGGATPEEAAPPAPGNPEAGTPAEAAAPSSPRSATAKEPVADDVSTRESPQAARGKCSFSPETPVLLDGGKTKPIADVSVGDRVESADPETGKHAGTRKVTATWINHDHDLIDVTVQGTDGKPATLHTTSNHPFWDETVHAWTPAGKLKPGDLLNTDKNLHAKVLSLHTTPGTANRYNLTVAQLHTYYVLAGGTPILVHNSDGCETAPLTRGQKVAAAPGADQLNPAQFANLKRFMKGAPSTAEIPVIAQRSDGLVDFSYRVPGRVPGSYAIYRKLVDTSGETVWAGKWTVTPDGSFAHIKEK